MLANCEATLFESIPPSSCTVWIYLQARRINQSRLLLDNFLKEICFKRATFINIVQAWSQSSVPKQTQLLVKFHQISANTFSEGWKSALNSTQLEFQSTCKQSRKLGSSCSKHMKGSKGRTQAGILVSFRFFSVPRVLGKNKTQAPSSVAGEVPKSN